MRSGWSGIRVKISTVPPYSVPVPPYSGFRYSGFRYSGFRYSEGDCTFPIFE